jgi:hypothetical protein
LQRLLRFFASAADTLLKSLLVRFIKLASQMRSPLAARFDDLNE